MDEYQIQYLLSYLGHWVKEHVCDTQHSVICNMTSVIKLCNVNCRLTPFKSFDLNLVELHICNPIFNVL